MTAEITWNGEAKTYQLGKVKFTKGRTELVDDVKTIKDCQITYGFSVQMIAAPKPPIEEAAVMPRGTKFKAEEVKPVEEVKSSEPVVEVTAEPPIEVSSSKPSRSEKDDTPPPEAYRSLKSGSRSRSGKR